MMEKLENVVASLRFCCEPNCICEDGCPYDGRRDGDRLCLDFLMEDALAVIESQRAELADRRRDIEVLTEDLTGAHDETHRLMRSLSVARAERDAARAKLARLIGERESAWVELGEKPMPNDYGEYVPEFPREGM